MKIENITLKKIEASEGKILTDGKGDFAKVKFLSDGQQPEDYHEIPVSEYQAMLAEQEAEAKRDV